MVAMDVDPGAVEATVLALREWCGGSAEPVALVADALTDPWPVAPDVVLGNPPFLGQLASATARSAVRRDRLRSALGPVASGYVDDSALFLLLAVRRVAPGGVVAMIQPESVLAAAAAEPVRAELAPRLRSVTIEGGGHFDAAVRVCVVGLADDGRPPVAWSGAVARSLGVPSVDLDASATLGELADVTGGFRDEYYGLVPHVGEWEPGRAPLATSGLIDPARFLWGERPTRFAKQRWDRPAVDVASLDALAPWARRHLVPKVLVATQTRVVEAVVDDAGEWLPCTPVLSVLPHESDRRWPLLAALLSPPVSSWALHTSGGSGLSVGAIKLSARQLRSVPLPVDAVAWTEATAAVRDGDLDGAAVASCAAYDVDASALLAWWRPLISPGVRKSSSYA
jgi:hypothetical protein